MRRGQSVGKLDGQLDQLFIVQAFALPQRLSVEQLHDQEWLAIRLIHFVDRADVRMIERRRRARFALKVFGFVDDAHPAGAERFQNPVMRDRATDDVQVP